MLSRNVPAEHTTKIVEFVYESNLLNRMKPSEVKKVFSNSGYFCKFYETFYEKQQSSKDLHQNLRNFTDFDLDLCSLEVVLIMENQIGENFESAFKKASDSRYVPIPVQRDLSRNEFDFKMNSANYGFDSIGLSEFEEWGTWTIAKTVVLHFLIYPLGVKSDVKVEFTVNPFLVGDKTEEEVSVYTQSNLLAAWIFDTSGTFPTKREFTIPRNLIQLGHVIIELRIKNPRSPYSLGLNGDKRDLGVGLIDVKFSNKQI